MNQKNTFSCPNCGEQVSGKAKACPHCGSDENTGWSDETYLEGIDLGDDFDYGSFLEEEGLVPKKRLSRKQRLIALVALILIVLFYILYIDPR